MSKEQVQFTSRFETYSSSVSQHMMQNLREEGFANMMYRIEDKSNHKKIGIEPTSTALAMSVVSMFSSTENGVFKEANLAGILCFVVDRSLKSRFFRLYDLNTSELLFQAELYINFDQTYKAIQPKFYCFPLHKTVIGFKFSHQYDAAFFLKLVKKFSFKGDAKEVLVESKKVLGLGNKISKPQ